MGLDSKLFTTSYVFVIPMKEKSADNGTELKNKFLNKACNQLGIKRLFSNPFHPQGNAKVENVYIFLKWTLTKFLESSDLEWDQLLPFTCYFNQCQQCHIISILPDVQTRFSRRTPNQP